MLVLGIQDQILRLLIQHLFGVGIAIGIDWFGLLHLENAIFDTDSDTDPDSELRNSS